MPPDSDAGFDATVDSLDRFERTIDAQLELITAIDEKAANVVRYTTLLVGAILTALSVVSRSDVLALDEIGVLPRASFYVGVLSFVATISVAIITYSSSVKKYGPNSSYGHVSPKVLSIRRSTKRCSYRLMLRQFVRIVQSST